MSEVTATASADDEPGETPAPARPLLLVRRIG